MHSIAHDTDSPPASSPRCTVRPLSEATYIKHELRRLRREIAKNERLMRSRQVLIALRIKAAESHEAVIANDMRPEYFR